MSNATIKLGDHEIDMPVNGVSDTGRILLEGKLTQWDLRPLPDDWDWVWQVLGKGEYVGSFPKRVGKFYWQTHNRKLTSEQLSEIGNLASQHTPKADKYFVRFAESFNWSRGDFADPDSCYWTCHEHAKNMILGAGGLTMRFYKSNNFDNSNGLARCWIIPHRAAGEQCYIVANGYGLSTLQCARVLAVHLDHCYYHKIELTNNGEEEGDLWINGGGTGYLVGPQSAVVVTPSINLEIGEASGESCQSCGSDIDEGEAFPDESETEIICESCYDSLRSWCEFCDEYHWDTDIEDAPDGRASCSTCRERHVTCCDWCCSDIMIDEMVHHDDNLYCPDCLEENHPKCDHCDERTSDGEKCDCQEEEEEEEKALVTSTPKS